ncbi:MAG: glycogen synthase [Tepidisphaerales bacterium]
MARRTSRQTPAATLEAEPISGTPRAVVAKPWHPRAGVERDPPPPVKAEVSVERDRGNAAAPSVDPTDRVSTSGEGVAGRKEVVSQPEAHDVVDLREQPTADVATLSNTADMLTLEPPPAADGDRFRPAVTAASPASVDAGSLTGGSSAGGGLNGGGESLPASEITPASGVMPSVEHPASDVPEAAVRDDSHLPPLLFEVGWEVCWQLGGIYTVLRSKAPSMIARWGDRYTLVGPYNPRTAAMEFEATPPEGLLAEAIDVLRREGLTVHHGRWLVTGRPRVLLIDHRSRFGELHNDKYWLWKDHGIGTDKDDGEVNEVVAFGFACARLFQVLAGLARGRPIIGHFHEWMGGVAVPRIAHLRIPVQTVFTTHATLLGRYLAGDNPYFYDHLPFLDPDREARHFNIYPRYQLEKAAAHASTVFSTVSDVTALEAEKLLGRTPDVIMPNGLNIQRFLATHEFQNLHNYYKERIHDFVRGHFFPSYSFDLDNTLYLLISGRYEYRNKGMDVYIEMLHRLNQRLREWQTRPTIVAFIITRAAVKNVNVRTLQSQTMYEDLRHTCEEIQQQMGAALFKSAAAGKLPRPEELLTEDNVIRLKRAIAAMKSYELPTIVTHDMVDDAGDPVLCHLRHRGLFNHPDDPVKVVYHPDFVTATSPLIGLDYEQFVRGCHMGVFPSYYEPWGYTPMECVALGIPACTTDLSGFGAYVMKHVELAAMQGIMVVRRRGRPFDAVVEDLTDHLLNFCRMTRRQRIDQRNRVERLSEMFDWSTMVRHYHEAHELALTRGRLARQHGSVQVVMV